MTRTATPPRLSRTPGELAETPAGLTLQVVWPVLDESMFDREAMREAARQWPGFVERHRVRLVGAPQMRVVELDDWQRLAFGAARAVICAAPVEKRPPQTGGEE